MKNKTRYLLIDTNIFIQCCLLELEEGDDLDVLKKLHDVLSLGKVKLLLPEIIELEFYASLNEKVEKLKKQIGKHKRSINEDSELDNIVKSDMLAKLSDCLKEREKNTDKVQSEISSIFSDKNT